MGATKKENLNNLYLSIYDGAFRQWVKEKTETSKTRTKTNGKTVEEELYSSVNGKLEKIYTYTETINEADVLFLIMYMRAEGDKDAVVIKTPFGQSFAQSFLLRLPNLNLDKEFTLKPYTILNEEKTAAKGKQVYNDYLIPYVGEEKVEAFFTKENNNGLPQIVIKKNKNGVVANVDTTDRDNFLLELVTTTQEKIQQLKTNETKTGKGKNVASPELKAELSSAEEDLPFR